MKLYKRSIIESNIEVMRLLPPIPNAFGTGSEHGRNDL